MLTPEAFAEVSAKVKHPASGIDAAVIGKLDAQFQRGIITKQELYWQYVELLLERDAA